MPSLEMGEFMKRLLQDEKELNRLYQNYVRVVPLNKQKSLSFAVWLAKQGYIADSKGSTSLEQESG